MRNYSTKNIIRNICAATVACTTQLMLPSEDAFAGQKEGIIKVEQVKQGIFNVTYKRRWEENYYATDVYLVDCARKIATHKDVRHLPLVSEEYLLEKICRN